MINGQRTSFSNVTLDGINIQDNFIRNNALDFLSSRTLIDQVAEFAITSQNGSPAVGGGASQVNFTTRSGGLNSTATPTGTGAATSLPPRHGFRIAKGLTSRQLTFNQFGGSLGGPAIKNRVFFFANYESLRSRSRSLANATILTPDAARGVFSYVDLAGTRRQVNVLELQGLQADPEAAKVLSRIPAPSEINNFDTGDSTSERLLNTAGYRFHTRDNGERDAVTVRGDWNATSQGALGVTYKYTQESNDRPDAGVGFHEAPPVQDFGHGRFLSAAWRSSFGPRFTNEARFGFNFAPGDFRNSAAPEGFQLAGLLYTNPTVNFAPQGRYTDTVNYRDDAMALIGRHSIRFGFDAQQVRVEKFDSFGVVPAMYIGLGVTSLYQLPGVLFPGGIGSADLGTAQALLASLAGIITEASQSFNIRDRSSGFLPGQETGGATATMPFRRTSKTA